MSSDSSQSQIKALLEGDKLTIRLLYDVLFPKVVYFVKNNKGTFKDAEEVFQNALFQFIAKANVKPIKIRTSLDAYLYVICRNLWRKELNKRKKEVRNRDDITLKGDEQANSIAILAQERWELFEEMTQKLSEKCIELLKDYFNNVPYKVLVKKFAFASENAAFQKVFKCKKQLTTLIKNDPRYKNLRLHD